MRTDGRDQETPPTLPGKTDAEKRLERQRAIAEGCALIGGGNSERWAADKVGIARSTLHDAYHRARSARSDQEREALDQELIGYAVVNASLAAEEIGRRLSDPARLAKIDAKTLTTIYGVHTDKVALKRRWTRPEDTGTENWLGSLASALSRVRSVTVQIADPVDQAVNVTPSQSLK